MEVNRARGLEVAYQRIGEGPLLVLVHGAGEIGDRAVSPKEQVLGVVARQTSASLRSTPAVWRGF